MKAIYGEPILAHGKTIVPVAKIMYGYGAGAGTGGVGDTNARGEGGGGGGGVRGVPVGVIEISDQQTLFVPITDRKKLAGAVLAGLGLGLCSVGADGADAAWTLELSPTLLTETQRGCE